MLGHLHRRVEQFGDGIVLDEPITVLAEDGVIPHAVLDGQPDEPAKQQVVLNPLDQLALGAHAVQHLQQHGAYQLLARCWAALDVGLAHQGEPGVHLGQGVVDPLADWSQRVVGRHKVLQPDHGDQRLVVPVCSRMLRSILV